MSSPTESHLYQKYIARNTYALFEYLDTKFARRMKLWQELCVMFSLIIALVISIAVVAFFFPAYAMYFMFGLAALMFGGISVLMTMGTYNGNYGNAFTVKRADRLVEILRNRGAMESVLLLKEYQDQHHDYIDSGKLDGILTASDQRQRFVFTNNIVHLPEQQLDDVVPPPVNDDYVRGYHALYRRLQAIQANPELLHLPGGLIDDMYADR